MSCNFHGYDLGHVSLTDKKIVITSQETIFNTKDPKNVAQDLALEEDTELCLNISVIFRKKPFPYTSFHKTEFDKGALC